MLTTIRLYSEKEVKISHKHKLLSENFIHWLKKSGHTNLKEEYRRGDRDRVDVLLNLDGCDVIVELKSVGGSSPKRAIREALGQLLDYQYYSEDKAASKLWVVLDQEVTNTDREFIKQLVEYHSIPLNLIWLKSGGFQSLFPIP